MKVIFYGAMLEYNLGIPSLLHGAEQLFLKLYGDKLQSVFYEPGILMGPINDHYHSDIRILPFSSGKELLVAAVKEKLHRKIPAPQKEFFDEVRSADVVVDLYGIYFCSNIEPSEYSYTRAIKSALSEFAIGFTAKHFFGVKTIKTAASYGPITTKGLAQKAKFVAKHVFDTMFAREKESQKQLEEAMKGVKKVEVTPDLGNLMKWKPCEYGIHHRIGISVSHQMIRQWKSQEDYITCIGSLIRHIHSRLPEYEVVLFPNETSPKREYNDYHVALDILRGIQEDWISIWGQDDYCAEEMKGEIAKCDILVSSRYHSCVAALSAGIPVLVIGWHYKYSELLERYGQGHCMIGGENCSSESLMELFEKVWVNREKAHHKLQDIMPKVAEELYRQYGQCLIAERNING